MVQEGLIYQSWPKNHWLREDLIVNSELRIIGVEDLIFLLILQDNNHWLRETLKLLILNKESLAGMWIVDVCVFIPTESNCFIDYQTWNGRHLYRNKLKIYCTLHELLHPFPLPTIITTPLSTIITPPLSTIIPPKTVNSNQSTLNTLISALH